MKKILVMTGWFYPHMGGAINDIREFSRRLVLRGYEIDIVVCNTRNASSYEQLDGIHIHRLDSWNLLLGEYPIPKPTPRSIRILWNMLRKKHGVVHVYSRFYINSFLGLILSRLKNVPLLCTELGARHTVSASKSVSILSRVYDHTLGALLINSADMVVVLCQASIPFLKHLGLRKEALLIPWGVDIDTFKRMENGLRKELGIEKATVITSVSRLIYAKGIQDLISAFPRIKQEIPMAKVLIVGSGDYETKLKTLAQETDREDIKFLGEKNQHEIAKILSITDIAVSTSYSEGLSASIREAGVMGLPVVATNVGGTPELVTDYQTGMLFEPGNVDSLVEKICQISKDKDLAYKLGNKAQQISIEKYNWDNITQRYCEVIDSLTGTTLSGTAHDESVKR